MKPNPRTRAAMLLLAAAAMFLGGGCANYEVTVESLARTEQLNGQHTSYCIRSNNPAVANDSLLFKEAAQHIKTALSAHGLWEAPTPQAADMVINLDYGLGPAHVAYDHFEFPLLPKNDRGGGSMIRGEENLSTGPTPDQELTENQVVPVTLREKHLTASCRENKPATEGRPPVELWRVNVSIDDEKANLREYLPILATAVMNQIGTTTDGVTTSQLSKTDDAIGFIKKGL